MAHDPKAIGVTIFMSEDRKMAFESATASVLDCGALVVVGKDQKTTLCGLAQGQWTRFYHSYNEGLDQRLIPTLPKVQGRSIDSPTTAVLARAEPPHDFLSDGKLASYDHPPQGKAVGDILIEHGKCFKLLMLAEPAKNGGASYRIMYRWIPEELWP